MPERVCRASLQNERVQQEVRITFLGQGHGYECHSAGLVFKHVCGFDEASRTAGCGSLGEAKRKSALCRIQFAEARREGLKSQNHDLFKPQRAL